MKLIKFIPTLSFTAALFLLTFAGCSRNTGEVWDDTKSCGRHVKKGFKTLIGQHQVSRQVCSQEEFMGWQEHPSQNRQIFIEESEYIPIHDEANMPEICMDNLVSVQPKETPGDANSSIPGLDAFDDPSIIPGAKEVFSIIHFEYNSNLVKGEENLAIAQNVAQYLKNSPQTYIFVEGHCDERGPEAYNLALGTRRSNSVRNLLIQLGANGEHIFTISYGKERPLVYGSDEKSRAANRRVEFKIYHR